MKNNESDSELHHLKCMTRIDRTWVFDGKKLVRPRITFQRKKIRTCGFLQNVP